MRFSVDAHAVGRKLTGNETYIRNLLHGYEGLDQESDFVAFVSEPDAERLIPERFETVRVSRNPFARLGWEMTQAVRRLRPDLLHVQYTAPLACPVPVVASVHDVSFEERPDFFPWGRALQLRRTVRRTVAMSRRILTPSEFSAGRIKHVYGIPDEKVAVIPNAVSGFFRPVGREQARAAAAELLGTNAPFVLMVGDLQPRKNQLGLIAAFEELMSERSDLPHHLVLVGQQSWYGDRVRQRASSSKLRDRIRLTGFVPDSDLVSLYNACEVFAFPSFYEGFGIPILEAMACGRAVACSNTTAVVEVADGAALTFDPASASEMARALRDLLVDTELRNRMERLGLQRASQFTWREAARQTLEVYYETAGIRREAPRQAGVSR